MTSDSTSDSLSILKDGKLKPGIYKIQNLRSGTYLDIHQYSNEVCCRPAKDLEEGRGLWEITKVGIGYAVKMVEPGKPDRFCNSIDIIDGFSNGTQLFVSGYLAAWRIEVSNDEMHRGFEYVRFYWGPTKKVWDLLRISSGEPNGLRVKFYDVGNCDPTQTWKLIPVKVDGTFYSPLPPYDGDAAGQSSTRAQHTESEGDDFGTIVTEVTTITTRKRYRVEDA